MAMVRYVTLRLLQVILVLLIVGVITFVIFYMLPTNPAQLSCGRPCSPETLRNVSQLMGTDKPWYEQMWDYLAGIFVGRDFGSGSSSVHCAAPCFGYSFQLNTSVTGLIASRFPTTASIAVGAAILWLSMGVAGGIVSALRRGKPIDRGVMTLAVAGVSAPVYVVGLLAILLFGFRLRWLPTGGYVPFGDSPYEWFLHLIMPWCTLAFTSAAVYARLTRAEMLETMGQDYVRTARAKGLRERRIILRHELRNAMLPVLTVFGLDLGAFLGGAVIVERVFSMQGLGALLVDSVNHLDLQVVVGLTLFSAFLIVFANFVVDLLYGLVDPRVRSSG